MRLVQATVAFPVFLGVAVISGYLSRSGSGDRQDKVHVDGRERTYTVHVPSNYDGKQPVPLLLALHGRLGTGTGEARLAQLDKVSDTHGFHVADPDELDRSWADGRGRAPSDLTEWTT